jgi:hypothetical protein
MAANACCSLECTLRCCHVASQVADIPDVDLSKVGVTKFGDFEVEVVDNTADYFKTLKARLVLGRQHGAGVAA